MTRTTEKTRQAETYQLAEARERRNRRVRDRHLLRHLPLSYAIARRYAGSYGSEQELIEVANRGLVRAVEEFDAASGQPFAAFAEPYIVSALEDHVHELESSRGAAAPTDAGDTDAGTQALASAIGRQGHVHDLAGFLECDVDVLVEGLMLAIAREPHLVPSPAAREQPEPGALRRVI